MEREILRAMSQADTEIVLRQFELWNEGDLDAGLQDYHPDVVVDAPEDWPEGSVTRGLDAWRQQAQRLRDTWKEARVEVDDIRSTDKGQVIARIRYITTGHDPGMAFETPMAVAFSVHEGKITRARYFWSMEALEAAGGAGVTRP